MEGLLTSVDQSKRLSPEKEELFTLSKPATAKPQETLDQTAFDGSSPEGALNTLRNQPDYQNLASVLRYLRKGTQGQHGFNIQKPSPQAAQIIHVLVTEIIPNYWVVLQEDSSASGKGELSLLITCLQSVSGINAALSYLRALTKEAKLDPTGLRESPAIFNLTPILGFLSLVLQGTETAQRIWATIQDPEQGPRTRTLRQELITLLAGGKIISLCAEAEDTLRHADKLQQSYWMADGKLYVDWIGGNLIHWVGSTACNEDDQRFCADLLSRAIRLGSTDQLVKKLFTDLLLKPADKPGFSILFGLLPNLEQRKVLYITLRLLSEMCSSLNVEGDEVDDDYHVVWAAAGALKMIIGKDETKKSNLISWLTSATDAGIGEPIGIRRAAIAALAEDKDSIVSVLEKSMNQFGDQLYIRHSPVLQQQAHAQVLLLAAGYTHRMSPIKLTILLRSSSYMNTISNRLAATQSRVRFLGMAVGEALSGLVHGKETKLDFHMDEMETADAKWYKSLVNVSDKVGPLDPLRAMTTSSGPTPQPKTSKIRPEVKNQARPAKPPAKSGFIIEEVDDDENDDDDDDDLKPYAKPDSDAEDSDDDPTLINRDKPKAPVYIRDLISYFRDTESYDKQKIALATAPTLIRRKAQYGTEVTSHAEELATLLVGLQDTFDMENFHNQRLHGMVAVVVAQPKKMGPWFAKTFFDGDFSLSQRASILIVLGLSGREIAGFETSQYAEAASFPSKALPAHIEKHFTRQPSSSQFPLSYSSRLNGSNLKPLAPNALDNLAKSLTQTFLAPMAAEAADAATGPDALKLSTFTSRVQKQQQQQSTSSSSASPQKAGDNGSNTGGGPVTKRRNNKKPPIRAIPNTTAALISTSFFFPLTARFQAAMRYSSSSSSSRGGSNNPIFDPHLLSLYLKTLALLLHASGPSTLSLPQMTSEFWDLLLFGVRGRFGNGDGGDGDMTVRRAVLFGMVALLDVNEGNLRGLCESHGREVVESCEWAGLVFHSTRGGEEVDGGSGSGRGEENELKMLAAGVLIRLREAMEKYQAVLMGDMLGVA